MNIFILGTLNYKTIFMFYTNSFQEENFFLFNEGNSFQLAARDLLHESSQRQDSTYHSICYTSHGALAETRNSSIVLDSIIKILNDYPYLTHFFYIVSLFLFCK